MLAVTFQIRAEEPLLLPILEGDPNSAISHSYIPGSVIRGALVDLYLANHTSDEQDLPNNDFDLAGDPKGQRLFFNGNTRYLNAYPLSRQERRTLPVPLSWFVEKDDADLRHKATIYDFAAETIDLPQLKHIEDHFGDMAITEDEDEGHQATVELTKPDRALSVHTARDRVKGRATQQEGAVFRYDALAVNEGFSTAILVASEADAGLIEDLLKQRNLWLGASRSGGYGRVTIHKIETIDWAEVSSIQTGLNIGDRLVLTLLSHLVIRDTTGSYVDKLTPGVLPAPLANSLELTRTYRRVIPTGGFNRKWGLPLNQIQAIQAGSVFVYTATASIAAADLQQIMDAGLGEGRAEGLGRIAFNWHGQNDVILSAYEKSAIRKKGEFANHQESTRSFQSIRRPVVFDTGQY